MAKQKKRRKSFTPQNPVLKTCVKTIRRHLKLGIEIHEQYQTAHRHKKKAEALTFKKRIHHITMCKEITDEILARDFQLDDLEEKFLTMPVYCGKNEKQTHLRLLEDLVRRHFHQFYPSIDEDRTINLSQLYKIIPIETKLGFFFKNLNRKFEGVLKFNVGNFNARKLELHQDKITVRITFLPEERP